MAWTPNVGHPTFASVLAPMRMDTTPKHCQPSPWLSLPGTHPYASAPESPATAESVRYLVNTHRALQGVESAWRGIQGGCTNNKSLVDADNVPNEGQTVAPVSLPQLEAPTNRTPILPSSWVRRDHGIWPSTNGARRKSMFSGVDIRPA